MKRAPGINWMCFGILIVAFVILIDTKLMDIPDVLAYIIAAIGGGLLFVGVYKYKKDKIKDAV